MKPKTGLLVGLAAAAACLTACQKEASLASHPPAREVRGQPIQRLATAASTNTAVTSAAVSPSSAANAALTPIASLVSTLPPAAKIGDYLVVGFDRLSAYNYEIPDESTGPKTANPAAQPDQIPPTVRALDKQAVALKGFMLPLRVEKGLVTELLIMRDQSMCCYGNTPRINEWVSVRMSDKGVKPIMDSPVTLFGKLLVGEMRENGYLVGIYQMEGDKMTAPEE
jgi:hypothetical protein